MAFEQYPLFDLAEWKNGLAFRKIDFSNTGRPVIKIAELKNGISSSTAFTQGEYDNAVKLQEGDMLFSWSGNPETSIDVFWYLLPEGWLNQHIFKVTPKNFVDREYLYYILKYLKPTFAAIASNKQTTGLGHVTVKDLKEILIDLPPLSIQQGISSYLATLDRKILLNQRINDNLQQQAQAFYANWCSQCDESVRIGDIVDNILDYTPSKHAEVVLINSSDVTEGHFKHHVLSRNENLKGHFKKRFAKYDVLYSEIRPKNKHFAYVLFDTDNYIASTRLMVIRAKQEIISPSLLYQHLSSERVCDEFASTTETRSGTFPQGCFADFANIEVPFRPVPDQTGITTFLDNVYKIMEHNDRENRRLEALRDNLLPKLMSGEIDVF